MNPRLAVVLVAFSMVLGVGAGSLVSALDSRQSRAAAPSGTTATSTTPEPTPTQETAAPTGPDGKPLELTLGAIGPVVVGDKVFEHMRTGYLVADQDPPCDGNHWLWAGELSPGLVVSATPDGTIRALGVSRPGIADPAGIGIGSTLQDLRDAYGELLNPPEQSDQGVAWAWVSEHGTWIGYALGPINEVGPDSKVEFIEVGTGEFVHHFEDAC